MDSKEKDYSLEIKEDFWFDIRTKAGKYTKDYCEECNTSTFHRRDIKEAFLSGSAAAYNELVTWKDKDKELPNEAQVVLVKILHYYRAEANNVSIGVGYIYNGAWYILNKDCSSSNSEVIAWRYIHG